MVVTDTLIDSSARDCLKTNLLPPLQPLLPGIFLGGRRDCWFSIHDPEGMQRVGRLIIKNSGPQSAVIKVAIWRWCQRFPLYHDVNNLFGKSKNSNLSHPWYRDAFVAVTTAEPAVAEAFYQSVDKAASLSRKPSKTFLNSDTWFWPSQPYNFLKIKKNSLVPLCF